MGDSELLQLRKLSSDELNTILFHHEVWTSTDHRQGERADLSEVDLAATNLRGANLSGADLSGTNLVGTDFKNANLQNADLTKAQGLLAFQLAGANLSGAKLPKEISTFDALAQVVELSKILKTIFVSMLVGCMYSWLTIFSTSDAHLLTNSTSSPLPIIQSPIPIADFYAVAPFILLAIFAYFHFYLARLWRLLATLPAIFPDGKRLDEKAYPWLLNSILRVYISRLRIDRPPLSNMEVFISVLLGWGLVPLTVILFWLRSLQKHDVFLTGILILWVALAISLTVCFWYLTKLTFRGKHDPLSFNDCWIPPAFYKYKVTVGWYFLPIATLAAVFAFVISDGVFNGAKLQDGKGCPRKIEEQEQGKHKQDEYFIHPWRTSLRQNIPEFLPCIAARASAELTELDVSGKPADWFLRPDNELPRIVKGAQLKQADLRYASARGAFLIKADLREAQLNKADLSEAQLQGADLSEAKLQGAKLIQANLQGAKLRDAELRGANLDGARLQDAVLTGAQLQDAHLEGAVLERADLRGAQLQSVDLTMMQLQGANLRGVDLQGRDLEGAQLQGANLSLVNLQDAHLLGTKLQNADLSRARLQGARLYMTELQGAKLGQAELHRAELNKAQLQETDLSKVIGLTQTQINEACIDSTTKLPPGIVPPKPCDSLSIYE